MVFLDAKRPVTFPLEGKLVVNEHYIIRKSHHATQKNKCPYMVHLNVPRDWFETNSRGQKRYSDGGKIFVGVAVNLEEQYRL